MADDQSQSMRVLYDQHGDALLAYAMCLTGDRAAAQDLVRESMLRAWRTPGLLDQSEGSARAWLFSVARHIAMDEWRCGRSRQEILTDLPEAESFDELLEAALRSWQIVEALLRLSVQHRQTLEECCYRGRTVAEASAMLGVPEGTIMSRLHYGRRAVRLVLAEWGRWIVADDPFWNHDGAYVPGALPRTSAAATNGTCGIVRTQART